MSSVRALSPFWLVSILGSTACALTSKGEPVVPRYFSPEPTAGAFGARPRSARAEPDLLLALGRVSGGAHLREKLMFRATPFELGYYEAWRWTEKPENYLRRALTRALFEERGITRALSGAAAPTLEVELLAFEELRQSPPLARLQMVVSLADDTRTWFTDTLSVEQPLRVPAGTDPANATVAALARALDEGTARVADHVIAALVARRSAQPAPDQAR